MPDVAYDNMADRSSTASQRPLHYESYVNATKLLATVSLVYVPVDVYLWYTTGRIAESVYETLFAISVSMPGMQ